MAIFNTKNRQKRELGFGSKHYEKPVRFINNDGSVNIKRTGLKGLNNLDIYHWLIRASRPKLAMVIGVGYIVTNLLFAWLYYLIGAEQFGGIDSSTEFQKFMSLFFFSAQTITTLGYGHIYPVNNAASIAAAFESLLGLLSFAIATGILFGRFSRPKADVLYSKNILISPYDSITGLMFRVTNKKQYELIEAEASVNVAMNDPVTNKREFYNLPLEISKINFLAFSWTIVHPIDENSPFYKLRKQDLIERDAEILILIKAIDETFSNAVYSHHSFKADELIENAKFKRLKQEVDKSGKVRVSVTDIHLFDLVN